MKRLIIFFVVLVGCSEDNEPVFRIEGGTYMESRFDTFANIAQDLDVTVPKNNMILRPVEDDNINLNDSRAYKKGDQLYIDIDRDFIDTNSHDQSDGDRILYQQLANGLLGTPFRDCGVMQRVENPDDLTGEDWDYEDYANLFDPSSPCTP